MSDTKVEILATRHYASVGMKQRGDVAMVESGLATQLVEQGFAQLVTGDKVAAPAKQDKPATTAEKKEK